MKNVGLVVVLMFMACQQTGYGESCPADLDQAVATVKDEMPCAAPVLDRTDIKCNEADTFEDVACVYWWYGSNVARGRMEVRADLAGQCVVHEAMHACLWLEGDECRSHATSCGWDVDEIERVAAKVLQ
jgi:hypothetical protein